MAVGKGELDWFEFETRMRKLIVDLVQPTVKKCNEDRENFGKLQAFAELQKARVDELETLLLKSDKQQTRFDEVFTQIADVVNQQFHIIGAGQQTGSSAISREG